LRLRGDRRLLGAEIASFGEPFLAAAVHVPHVFVPVDLQLPERPRREPVVVVAVEHDRGLVVDAAPAEQRFELVGRHDVAHQRIAQLRRPVPADGPRNVSLFVRGRIDVHFDNAHAGVGGVLRNPVGGDENAW
jgi:hypothetical protein